MSRLRFFLCHEKCACALCAVAKWSVCSLQCYKGKYGELFLASSSQFDSELSTQKPPQQQHMPDIRRGTKIETFQF